jgi:hypothetical protein
MRSKLLPQFQQRLQSSWHAEIATVRVTGTRRMLSSHAAGCWILETVNFPAARCDTCPVPQIAQNDASLPYVPDLGYIFPEVGILLHRLPSLTTDQRFVILNQLVWDHDIPPLFPPGNALQASSPVVRVRSSWPRSRYFSSCRPRDTYVNSEPGQKLRDLVVPAEYVARGRFLSGIASGVLPQ